ncbi:MULTISPECIES: anti-sigma-F factor Fin family protein [Bacillaceae]|uniref:Anti-sigma-F factor Fin family protein n=1 Tax=Evansella alkalicola TaxID=745819 RepID=A0ABS6JV75_9BACI|nr:anti-sigma-F factor Fin family protein [Litchfieldia alkalitelluris]MBU9721996.1 anti-sigma-F factor Fin family protein [Bacillus alkalicola]
MAIHYYCKHCRNSVGKISDYEADDHQLGFNQLSEEERQEMIEYDSQGHLQVKVICEECENTLRDNPDYHVYESFLH